MPSLPHGYFMVSIACSGTCATLNIWEDAIGAGYHLKPVVIYAQPYLHKRGVVTPSIAHNHAIEEYHCSLMAIGHSSSLTTWTSF